MLETPQVIHFINRHYEPDLRHTAVAYVENIIEN